MGESPRGAFRGMGSGDVRFGSVGTVREVVRSRARAAADAGCPRGALPVTMPWRDPGPAPPASSPAVAAIMRRTGRRDTAPELALRRALHRRGLRYLVDTTPPGTNRRRRADLVFRGARVAVFLDGCFWHSCPVHAHPPKANAAWWGVKLASITARDRDTDRALAAAGWHVVRVWEHEDVVAAADRVHGLVHARAGRLRRGAVGRQPARRPTPAAGG